jgi:membrane-bound ClpP family serine protease
MNSIRQLTGVALVIIGALFLIIAYLVGWTSSNIVLLIGLIIIIIGIIMHVKLAKSGEKY